VGSSALGIAADTGLDTDMVGIFTGLRTRGSI
jgi:hypothetical protein